DMLKVPGTTGSLEKARTEGADVRVVYGIEDAVAIARKMEDREVVFIGIGFETTAPTTATVLRSSPPPNFSVLSCHRTVPNALRFILESGEVKLHGLVEPGHVSVILGMEPYRFLTEEYGVPQVITGFEPLDLLMGIYMLVKQVSDGEARLENEYTRVVRPEGNPRAIHLMEEVFRPTNVAWRGFPVIPESGLGLREEYAAWDARKKFADVLKPLEGQEFKEHPGCKCGDVLRGVMEPDECPLFGKGCSPTSPLGPCMVSFEGGCAIAYKYGKKRQ
ncbi:MAG: hydrogenase formation protein HypD, partial [Thermoplasmata archaeon]|nr:hydrogenase formation protein HypD [Thermoplasmata archaeon]